MYAPITSALRPRATTRNVLGALGVLGLALTTGAWAVPPEPQGPAAEARQPAVVSSAADTPASAPHRPVDDDLAGVRESYQDRAEAAASRGWDRDGDSDLSEALEQYRAWKAGQDADNDRDPYGRSPYGSYGREAVGATDPYGPKHSPSPSPTVSPTASPKPTKTAKPSPRPSVAPTRQATLPVTGGEVGTMLLAALGLGAGGAALRLAGRRRSPQK